MFKRIYDNLFKPSEIGKYLKDKVGYVILYILFLSIVVNIPLFIELGTTEKTEDAFKLSITNAVISEKLESKIEDYQYIGESVKPFVANNYIYIGFNSSATNLYGITFMFDNEELNIYVGGQIVDAYSYSDLKLENINFSLKDNTDKEKLQEAIGIVYNNYKTYIIVSTTIGLVIQAFLLTLLLILLFSWLYSYFIPKLFFKYRFIIISYAATIYLFTILLDNLIGFKFASYIGIILMGMNARKAIIKTIALTLFEKKEEDTDE